MTVLAYTAITLGAFMLLAGAWSRYQEPRRRRAVLKLLGEFPRRELYGREIHEQSNGVLTRNTVYLTLTRMEEDGLIASRIVNEDAEPSRRLYRLTEAGREAAGLPAVPSLRVVSGGRR